MKRTFIFALLVFFAAGQASAFAYEPRSEGACKKKKKPKPPTAKETEETGDDSEEEEKPTIIPKDEEEGETVEDERSRVENAKVKSELEGRTGSKITPGTASRWSNKGAMAPIESEVPITKRLPTRAVPRDPGVETPGQSLVGGEELLHARIFVSGYHLATNGQNAVYQDVIVGTSTLASLTGRTQNIDVLRWRMSVAYERIAGSDFGTHLDLEYRAKANGSIPTDHRINELYLSYGLTDFRRDDATGFGISVGRVAIREAGYAQVDGGLFRAQLTKEIKLGAFAGVTGNPYGYNWNLKKTQEFSTDWIRGGGFGGYRTNRFFSNFALVATYARLARAEGTRGLSGLDRIYLYGDASYLITPTLNALFTGWVDVIGGHPFQNIELAADWIPVKDLDLRLSFGRFSTVLYDVSAAYTFFVDQQGNRKGDNVYVDENGVPIVPFDAVLGSAIYNSIRFRAGYRIIKPVEVYLNSDIFLRDSTVINQLANSASGATLQFSTFRATPGGGIRFRDPDIVDAALGVNIIVDKESQATSLIQASVGRGIYGLYGQVDVRHYFGKIGATDGGLDVSYTMPRDWFPGRVLLRGTLRYYVEAIPLGRVSRPIDGMDGAMQIISNADALVVVNTQSSVLGFLSVEWRL